VAVPRAAEFSGCSGQKARYFATKACVWGCIVADSERFPRSKGCFGSTCHMNFPKWVCNASNRGYGVANSSLEKAGVPQGCRKDLRVRAKARSIGGLLKTSWFTQTAIPPLVTSSTVRVTHRPDFPIRPTDHPAGLRSRPLTFTHISREKQ
jgi:hypothetical protein